MFNNVIFRSLGALVTSFLIVFVFCPNLISYLKHKQTGGQPIREDGPQSHLTRKSGTPTMGGILIILAIVFSSIIWGSLLNTYLWLCITVILGFGLIGAFDDYQKVSKHDYHGISAKMKFGLQIAISAGCCYLVTYLQGFNTVVHFPIFKNIAIDFGWLFIPWAIFIMTGSSNAVNITDGLDGLAVTSIITTSICLTFLCYFSGCLELANCLNIPHIQGITEICVFLCTLIGACLGFLPYNAFPAKIFMGDVGSISIGAVLGFIAVIAKQEILFAIIGGVFVIETLSDLIQIMYYKKTHKRIFKMAPLHHHFEKLGWSEPTIVFRFFVTSIILGIIGMSLALFA